MFFYTEKGFGGSPVQLFSTVNIGHLKRTNILFTSFTMFSCCTEMLVRNKVSSFVITVCGCWHSSTQLRSFDHKYQEDATLIQLVTLCGKGLSQGRSQIVGLWRSCTCVGWRDHFQLYPTCGDPVQHMGRNLFVYCAVLSCSEYGVYWGNSCIWQTTNLLFLKELVSNGLQLLWPHCPFSYLYHKIATMFKSNGITNYIIRMYVRLT